MKIETCVRVWAVLLVLGAIGLIVPNAQAHDLTCSRDRFSHWPDLRRDSRLIADDKPRVECIQIARNKVKIIGGAAGSRYTVKQFVLKVHEKTYGWHNSPFYYEVGYAVSAPVYGTHG